MGLASSARGDPALRRRTIRSAWRRNPFPSSDRFLEHLHELRDHAELFVFVLRTEYHGFEFMVQRLQDDPGVLPLIVDKLFFFAAVLFFAGVLFHREFGAAAGSADSLDQQTHAMPAAHHAGPEQAQAAIRNQR